MLAVGAWPMETRVGHGRSAHRGLKEARNNLDAGSIRSCTDGRPDETSPPRYDVAQEKGLGFPMKPRAAGRRAKTSCEATAVFRGRRDKIG